MRLVIVSTSGLGDAFASSGTPSAMADAFQRHGHDVVRIGNVSNAGMRAVRAVYAAFGKVTKRPVIRAMNRPYAFFAGRALATALEGVAADAVIVPKGAVLASQYRGEAPMMYLSDTTFDLMDGYYTRYTGDTRWARRSANRIERQAIHRADLVNYATRWAADSALSFYGAPAEKVTAISWGANSVESSTEPDPGAVGIAPLRLLIVGKNWQRKGVDTAVAAVAVLRQRGVDATLTVVGASPPQGWTPRDGVEIQPPLDPGNPVEGERLRALFASATAFVMPTEQEAQGRVLAEAASFGLPAVATDTGGVSSIVRDGVTGRLVAPGSPPEDWADAIADLVADADAYRGYRARVRASYVDEHNWETWAEEMTRLLGDLID